MEKTEIKERPIIMGAESVRAILEGRKTQTRRVVKADISNCFDLEHDGTLQLMEIEDGNGDLISIFECCPYGKVGDRLWVRETFVDEGSFFGTLNIRTVKDPEGIESEIIYRADDNDFVWTKDDGTIDFDKKKRRCASHWKSPIFMPRWASRITLEITDIRVERVQDITENDARAEGMTSPLRYIGALRDAYIKTWNSLNAKRGYPWESNPWVWVVSFKVVKNGKE